MNALYLDPEAALEVEHGKTDVQKGGSFTKALGPQAFVAAREKLGMRQPQVMNEVKAEETVQTVVEVRNTDPATERTTLAAGVKGSKRGG